MNKWNEYINYVSNWAVDHKDVMFEGMSPACYLEWLDNEYSGTPYEEHTKEYNFYCDIDTTNVVDSMQLDSGQVICTLDYGNARVYIAVQGDVRVNINEDDDTCFNTYKYPSEFPKWLKELIAEKPYAWDLEDNIEVCSNNWFEIFYEDEDSIESDVIDIEECSPKDLLKECLSYYYEIHKD